MKNNQYKIKKFFKISVLISMFFISIFVTNDVLYAKETKNINYKTHKQVMYIDKFVKQQFDPIYTESLEDEWQGYFVYLGKDATQEPIRWLLLNGNNTASNLNTNKSLFLFSDRTIGSSHWYHAIEYGMDFSTNFNGDYWQNGYTFADSDLKVNMENEMSNIFSNLENNSITNSSAIAESGRRVAVGSEVIGASELVESKWFPLSASEITDNRYGFSKAPFDATLAPTGISSGDRSRLSFDKKSYYTRSYRISSNTYGLRYSPVLINEDKVCNVLCEAGMNYTRPTDVINMRPAMNVEQNKISLVKDSNYNTIDQLQPVMDSNTNSFKLALYDNSQQLTIQNTTKNNNVVQFDYNAVGEGKYLNAIIEDSNNNIIYYGTIKSDLDINKTGNASINLSDNGLNVDNITTDTYISPGKFRLSVFTEILNDNNLTDYTSTLNHLDPIIKVPEAENQPPVINAENREIATGFDFDALENVSATDFEDGDIVLTQDNIIFNNVDSSVAGVYRVTYKVTDSGGLITEKTIEIKVNALPIINANNLTLTINDVYDPLENVSASDLEDGDLLLTETNIIFNNVNVNIAGVYNVTYKVTDSFNQSTTKTIEIVVIEKTIGFNNAPIINAVDKEIGVNTSFDPLLEVSANDAEDGIILLDNSNIIFNNVDVTKAGLYTVVYQVQDSLGLKSEKTINVRVNALPVINAQDRIIKIGDIFDPLYNVSATDLEDGNIKMDLNNVIYNDVDAFTIGTYKVTYKVTDKFNQSSLKTIKVIVKKSENVDPDNAIEEKNNTVDTNSKESKTTLLPQTGDSSLYVSLIVIINMIIVISFKKRNLN